MSRKKKHQYITFRNFCDITIMGIKREILRGCKCLERNGMIVTLDGEPIANIHSENGRHHFAYDGDRNGLERGFLTYAIATAARENRYGEGFRLREYERQELLDKYPQYVQFGGGFLFTDAFYHAPISDLREIAQYMGIKQECIVIPSNLFGE